jgi:hypothetical protein
MWGLMSLFGGLAAVIVVVLLVVLSVIAAMPWLAVGVPGGPPSNVEVVVPLSAVQPQSPGAAPVPMLAPAAPDNSIASTIAKALTWVGVRYVWGGCTRQGIDCSCFVMNVLATVGIHAPRTTVPQLAWTSPVSAGEARAGDLVFFDNTCSDCGPNPTHVGIYLGGGRMVDCGDPCRVEAVYGGHSARYGRVPGL